MTRSSVFYNCFLRLFGDGGFDGPEPPDGGCDNCGGGCTGEGCGCVDCDPGDDPCDDLVTLSKCPPGNVGPCIDIVYSKQQLVDSQCLQDCQDPVRPNCQSCSLGFLPEDCVICCPSDPPPPPQTKLCVGYYCASNPCDKEYADGGCVEMFQTQVPINDPCPVTWNGNTVYTTYQQALLGELCYSQGGAGGGAPGVPGGGGGGGGGAPPPPIAGSLPCTLYKCVIVNQSNDTDPEVTFIDRECLATTQTVFAWIAQFNLTTTGPVSCDLVKANAAAYGYYTDSASCEAVCQDQTVGADVGGGGGDSVSLWVCNGPGTGQCNLITTASENVDSDGKLVTTGQQTYDTESECRTSSECCLTVVEYYWRCNGGCDCVQDVEVVTCGGVPVTPPTNAYVSKDGCESITPCCKGDVASAAQLLSDQYPFDVNGLPIGGMVAYYCPGDDVLIQPVDTDTIVDLSQDYALSFETSHPNDIQFNETTGDISLSSNVLANPNAFFKIKIERDCCSNTEPVSIDVLISSLVRPLDPSDPSCNIPDTDTPGGIGVN